MNQFRHLHSVMTVIVFVLLGFLQLATTPTRDSYLRNYDHGYQLGAGVQVLHGKTPGVDILAHYGPMVFYASALWYRLSGSLLGETIACALGYALCLAIIYALISRHVSRIAGLLGASAGFLLEARFYKWYLWLFPLGTIWLLDRVAGSTSQARRPWIAATGLWVGLGWLFRWDVGTTGAAVCLLYLLFIACSRENGVQLPWKNWAAFGLPFVLPPLAWFIYLFSSRGWAGPSFFVWQSLNGAVNVSRAMTIPLPSFNPADPLSPASVIVLGYALLIAIYAVCGLMGLYAEWQGQSTRRSRLLLAVALVGLSTFHQGFISKGSYHLLQVIPPLIVGFCVLISVFYERVASSNFTDMRARAVRFVGFAFLVSGVIAGLGLMPAGRVDLSSFRPWPSHRLRELAHPLEATQNHGAPLLSVLRKVRAATDRNDPVLVFPVDSQYLALLDRPVSGRLTVFVGGFFDQGIEAEKNLEAIRRSMPKFVILTPELGSADLARSSRFHHDSAKAHGYLLQFIEANFKRKFHECDRCVVLARDSLDGDGAAIARGRKDEHATDRR
jgi:hypothetical protein